MKELYTKAGENLSGTPWNVYPRPQLKRDSFYCLNGEWEFAVTDGEAPAAYDRKILVPFAPESLLSGVHIRFDECKTLWYRRTFTLPHGFVKSRVILHFGAVDQICKIYLNGSEIAEHIGGYHAFSVDITGHMQAENTLVVRVNDNLSNFKLPYGKQCKKHGGMWYTSVSGIWQTVWLESVPESYISGIKITTEGNTVNVKISGIDSGEIRLGETATRIEDGEGTFEVPSPHFWSPEHPHLYYFTVQSGEDLVQSYFALRDLEIKEINGKSRLCLNGAPYFFHGLLDQGYYS
nr:glycoside hydrolase family 2 [Clostridia bacterium]